MPPEEATILRAAADGSERLDQITHQIFQGLITGADDIYVLEDRGWRGSHRIVWSRASGRELELEPDLLNPLASGGDVKRYAFRPFESLLLFPYRRGNDERMRLLTDKELGEFELSSAYLQEHEDRLRSRERRRMDYDGWYAFARTQNLGLHDHPKLGVPRLCERLRVALDEEGSVYLDNVDVNGVLFEGPVPWALIVELNSRLVDWIFRRLSVPFQNEYWSANKQFIAGLPIRVPEGSDASAFAQLGKRLHELSRAASAERTGFLDWLASSLGIRRSKLPQLRQLERFETLSGDELVALLARSRARLQADPRERTLSDLIRREHRASVERLSPISIELAEAECEADDRVFDLYELPAEQRRLVEVEYE